MSANRGTLDERVTGLTQRVQSMTRSTIPSPIEVARLQIEIENEMLQLRLDVSKMVRVRSESHYKKFRSNRWDSDTVQSYNEASLGAKAEMAKYDQRISEAKAYITYLENLASILKNFTMSQFRD